MAFKISITFGFVVSHTWAIEDGLIRIILAFYILRILFYF